jgi:hypothetical protein
MDLEAGVVWCDQKHRILAFALVCPAAAENTSILVLHGRTDSVLGLAVTCMRTNPWNCHIFCQQAYVCIEEVRLGPIALEEACTA